METIESFPEAHLYYGFCDIFKKAVLQLSITMEASHNSEDDDPYGVVQELADETQLTEREAELYILHADCEETISHAAHMMDIERGTAASMWDRVKTKIREARNDKTAELEILTENRDVDNLTEDSEGERQ